MVQTDQGYTTGKGLAQRLKKYPTFYDQAECNKLGVSDDTLITPLTAFKNRIKFKVYEFDKLIDSCNIEIDD